MHKTIHLYRETHEYKKLAEILSDYEQSIVDNLYMSFTNNTYSRNLLEERLNNLNLDPQTENKIFSIFT